MVVAAVSEYTRDTKYPSLCPVIKEVLTCTGNTSVQPIIDAHSEEHPSNAPSGQLEVQVVFALSVVNAEKSDNAGLSIEQAEELDRAMSLEDLDLYADDEEVDKDAQEGAATVSAAGVFGAVLVVGAVVATAGLALVAIGAGSAGATYCGRGGRLGCGFGDSDSNGEDEDGN